MNTDYDKLMSNYKGSQVYDFIINYLNKNHKDWTEVNEIGGWAPELVLYIITFCVDDDSINNINKAIKENIVENIKDEYPKFKKGFKEVFEEEHFNSFETEDEYKEAMTFVFLDKLFFNQTRQERDFVPFKF